MQKIKDFKVGKTIWKVFACNGKVYSVKKVTIHPHNYGFFKTKNKLQMFIGKGDFDTINLQDHNACGLVNYSQINSLFKHKVFFTPQAAYKYFNKLKALEANND